jgi:L-rhamnose mutarotase
MLFMNPVAGLAVGAMMWLEESSVQRICFVLKVRADRLAEYRGRHREVWPEMRAALTATGWRDYTLFLRPDGLLVGYLSCEDFETSTDAMKALEVNEQWQREMAPFFENIAANPDDEMQPLEEIFHLD